MSEGNPRDMSEDDSNIEEDNLNQINEKTDEYTENDTKIKDKEKDKVNEHLFQLGNGNLYFLPAKLNATKRASVDRFFEVNIEKESESSRKNCMYTNYYNLHNLFKHNLDIDDSNIDYFKSSFRGRHFHGIKLDTTNKYNLQYVKLSLLNKSDANVEFIHNFTSQYVWRFDEKIKQDNSLANVNLMLDVMECLG